MSRRPSEGGYSLIEALVALVLLAAVLVFTLGALSSFKVATSLMETRGNAAIAARARMEQVRFTDPATLPTSGSDTMLSTVGAHVFTVETRYCINTAYCDDNTRHVVVNVQEDGQDVFETESVFTQLR